MKKTYLIGAFVVLALLGGCQMDSRDQALKTSVGAVQLRSFQSRAYDTQDDKKTLRTVIATLQDLGFVIDKADATLGSVSATKLNGYALRMTVTVRQHGSTQVLVRANAQYQDTAVEEAGPYQQFFDALSKAMFLTAHEVD